MTALPPTISQIGYPGAGDIDDCWCVATIWAAVGADPDAERPTVPEFRAAAHNPDRPGPTGGDLDDVIRGASQTWPYLTLERHDTADWETFARRIAEGWYGSLAVLSSALPARLQYGFRGAHQVGVAIHNGWRVMNPLARDGSTPGWIEEHELRTAARAVDRGRILAALFEPWKEVVALPIYVQRDRPGTLTVRAGATVTGYRPIAAGWQPVKTWEPKPAASTARFDAHLSRLSGTTRPASLLRVISGYFDGLYVSTAEVDETFDPPSVTFTLGSPVTVTR